MTLTNVCNEPISHCGIPHLIGKVLYMHSKSIKSNDVSNWCRNIKLNTIVSYDTALYSKMLNSEIIYANKRLQVSFLFNTATIMIAKRGIPDIAQCRLALQRRQNYYKPHYLNNEMLFTRTCNYIWFRMIMDKKILVSCDCPEGM